MVVPVKLKVTSNQLKRETTMDEKIIAVDCLSGDLLKAFEHHEDPQSRMSDAEVMTVAIVAYAVFWRPV